MQIGLYIHIPFCASKCYYCDFLSFPGDDKQSEYVKALVKEMEQTKENLAPGTTIKSIFIGGGTPTVLPPLLLEQLCCAVVENFTLETNTEWTIEANPGTLDEAKIKTLAKFPITRISLGLQSSHDHLLKAIGRLHTFKEWEDNIKLIKKLTNWQINSDLMFALPNQTEEEFKQTLETIVSYELEHLSIYALIIEEETHFGDLYEAGKLSEVEEQLDRNMYHYAQQYLKDHGYEQYEISNWAKAGCECIHNKVYWRLEPYLGIGLGAHGLLEGKRYYNEENIKSYIEAAGNLSKIRYEEELLTEEMAMEEYMFLGLRLLKGISQKDFEERFGCSVWTVYEDQLSKWIKYKVLVQDKDRIYLSNYGLDVCNEVFASFL